ncbi:MAG: hypothetical protein ACP5T3_02665 [Candidatus Micrarchaeia archaeon]
MKGLSLLAALLLGLVCFAGIANAEYWFQSGARAGNSAAQNNGAMVSIETVANQQSSSGSMAFWVGENLQNGAFLQVGYTVENQTGYYPTNCTVSGCSSTVLLTAGKPTWFYEYFLPGDNSSFLGAMGPDGSAGANGTFHTYGFYSLGDTWHVLFDGKQIGAVNLGTSSSGPNPPVAIAELANSSGYTSRMLPVIFANLSAYKYDTFLPVENAYAIISYGVGSKTSIPNPYGVEEIGNRVNYFEVGSGLPTSTNGTELWHLGYWLRVLSPFGNINSSIEYAAYSQAQISAPAAIYFNKTARAVFSHWEGTGPGAYTGTANSSMVNMYGNITERANYTVEYFVNVTGNFSTYGTGWYPAGSIAKYGVYKSNVYISNDSRFAFVNWSNGNANANGTLLVNRPVQLHANYEHQLLVSVSSQYGNATGSGWIQEGSNDTIMVLNPFKNISASERFAFVKWSNGSTQQEIVAKITKPVTLKALFAYEYKVDIHGKNYNGSAISPEYYIVNGMRVNSSTYMEPGSYSITGAVYKGTLLNFSYALSVLGPESINVTLPVYTIDLSSHDIFGLPVNATLYITFANGTTTTTSTGATGSLMLYNIPYGYAKGTAEYLFTESFATAGGKPVELVFISPSSLLVVIVLLLICVLVPVWLWKEKHMNIKHNYNA